MLSSTAVDFIKSEGIAERQHLIWGKAVSLNMPRAYRGVKSVTQESSGKYLIALGV